MGGKSKPKTQVVTQKPLAEQFLLNQLFPQASNLASRGILGQTANVDPLELQARLGAEANLTQSAGLAPGALNALASTASGQSLNPLNTPGVGDALNTIASDVTDRVNAQFGAAGRTNSGLRAQALARGITQGQSNAVANLANQAQGRQLSAASQLANIARSDLGQLNQLGLQGRALHQSRLDAPFNNLQRLQALLQSGGGTTSQPIYHNTAGNVAGGALTGLSLFGGPAGAIGGAVLGGLL